MLCFSEFFVSTFSVQQRAGGLKDAALPNSRNYAFGAIVPGANYSDQVIHSKSSLYGARRIGLKLRFGQISKGLTETRCSRAKENVTCLRKALWHMPFHALSALCIHFTVMSARQTHISQFMMHDKAVLHKPLTPSSPSIHLWQPLIYRTTTATTPMFEANYPIGD